MKPRVYADTSVFGGFFDDEFAQHSIALVEQFRTGVILLIVSDLTLQELESAPQKVGDLHKSIPIELVEFVTLDDDAKFLASKYIEEEAISKKHLVDAQHIAIASANRADVLVSWNFSPYCKFKTYTPIQCNEFEVWLSID